MSKNSKPKEPPQLQINVGEKDGNVIVRFQGPIAGLFLSPVAADQVADALKASAAKIRGEKAEATAKDEAAIKDAFGDLSAFQIK